MGGIIMVRALKNRPGISMVEICIGVLIIAVATLIMANFSRNTFLMSRDARGREAAFLTAQKKISELQVQRFAMSSTDATKDKDTVDNIICDRTWTVKDTCNIKRVIVTVTYKSLRGTDRQVTLSGAIK
jgi:Tfp pilus assembly protein PilV